MLRKLGVAISALGFAAGALALDTPVQAQGLKVGVLTSLMGVFLLLVRDEPMRFNALRRAIEGISQKMLSQVLKSLERDGLIRRRVIATVPVTVEYSITPLGATLATALDPLRDWAESNLKDVLNAQRRYDAQRNPMAA